VLREQHVFQFVTENEDLDILGPRNVTPNRRAWNLITAWLYFGTVSLRNRTVCVSMAI
jgi:hypothetical protein